VAVLLWVGFAVAVVLLVALSRFGLALGLAVGALALGAFALSPAEIGAALWQTVSDPSVLVLALVVLLIPVLGGVMEASGQMARLVGNLRVGVRPFLALAPGLLGMLPMPGGALLSAPLVERGAGHVAPDVKAAANVWFRHVLLLVYPLGSSLIASAKVAGLDVYATIPYLAPAFALSVLLGGVFLLRNAHPKRADEETGSASQDARGPFSLRDLLVPLGILLVAPALDLALASTVTLPVREIATAAGVVLSLALSLVVGRVGPKRLLRIVSRARPWTYAAIIVAMFAFLNVFASSGVPERLAAMRLPPLALCLGVGFALGLITGRIEASLAVVLPIYASAHGPMTLPGFALAYYAAFLGYVVTPVHPCISVSVAYFKTSIGALVRRLALPVLIGAAVALLVGWFVF
jgi:integral membrane protein (TIGR00529 family)